MSIVNFALFGAFLVSCPSDFLDILLRYIKKCKHLFLQNIYFQSMRFIAVSLVGIATLLISMN